MNLDAPLRTGTRVRWTSQSAGITKTKTGAVVCAVAPGQRPAIKNAGQSRMHVSYLVRSDNGRLYWPRVSHLEVMPTEVA